MPLANLLRVAYVVLLQGMGRLNGLLPCGKVFTGDEEELVPCLHATLATAW